MHDLAENNTFTWSDLYGHLKKNFKLTFELVPSQLYWTLSLIQSPLGKTANKHTLIMFFF